jgi:histone H2A
MTTPEKKNRKHKDYTKFSNYIYKVLKQVHPDTRITNYSLEQMNQFVIVIARGIIHEGKKVLVLTDKETMTSREIQYAVRSLIPGELAKHAVSEGVKAVTKYNASVTEDGGSNLGSGKNTRGKSLPHSRSHRSGLTFPVARFETLIRKETDGRVGVGAPVYLAAVCEYLVAEVLELAGNAARDNNFVTIKTRHIAMAILNDNELDKLCGNFRIEFAKAGVMPKIHDVLIPEGKPKKKVKKEKHPDEVAGIHKPHRFRPGTVALRNIRKYQKSTGLLMQKLPFKRLVKAVCYGIYDDVKFKDRVIEGIQSFIETRVVDILSEAQIRAIDAQRQSVSGLDIERSIPVKLASIFSNVEKVKFGKNPKLKGVIDIHISEPALRRLAYRSGIKRIKSSSFDVIRKMIEEMVYVISKQSINCMEYCRKKMISMAILRSAFTTVGYNYIVA